VGEVLSVRTFRHRSTERFALNTLFRLSVIGRSLILALINPLKAEFFLNNIYIYKFVRFKSL
jgi:hypothetical protein